MKGTVLILAALLIFSTVAFAGDDTEYEVSFTVRYNAVSIERATQIASYVMRMHADACKTELKIKKVGEDSGWFITPTSDNELDIGGNVIFESD